jgi:hypothetical protein
MSAVTAQPADAEAVRALAGEILQRPEYAAARAPEDFFNYLRVLLEALEWILELLDRFNALRFSAPGLFWLILGVMLGVLVLLVAHMSWAISRALRDSGGLEKVGEPPTPLDFSSDARRLAADGCYLEAAHRLLLATLQHLARGGLIELRPEDTNRRLRTRLEEARLPGALRRELATLMGETERLWFRDRRDDRDLYDRWSTAYSNLQEATR